MAIEHSKDNPFKRYLEYLNEMGDLDDEEKHLYSGISKEFLNLLENTSMSKVYKMPVLMAFYNDGNILMEVTEEQLLITWKKFFNTGTNWKDLDKNMTYEKYCRITDKEHVKKILQMPVHFLQESGKGFFVKNEGSAIALCDDLKAYIGYEAFARHFKDIIDYRANDYYKRRYDRNL